MLGRYLSEDTHEVRPLSDTTIIMGIVAVCVFLALILLGAGMLDTGERVPRSQAPKHRPPLSRRLKHRPPRSRTLKHRPLRSQVLKYRQQAGHRTRLLARPVRETPAEASALERTVIRQLLVCPCSLRQEW